MFRCEKNFSEIIGYRSFYSFLKIVLVFQTNKSIEKATQNKIFLETVLQETVLTLHMTYHVIMQGNVLDVIQIFHG